jgi:hypothetical protein
MEKQGVTIHWLNGAGDPLCELLRIADQHGRQPQATNR